MEAALTRFYAYKNCPEVKPWTCTLDGNICDGNSCELSGNTDCQERYVSVTGETQNLDRIMEMETIAH